MNSRLYLRIKFVIVILATLIAIISGTNYVSGQAQSVTDNTWVSETSPNFELSSNSNSYFSEFMSEQNFTNFSEFNNLTDFAMPNFFFRDVNGTYIDSDIGYQIDLPKDWKGKESKFMMNMVFVAPEEINLEDIEEPGTFIIIFGLDKEYFDMITDLTQLPSFDEEAKEELSGNKDESVQDIGPLGNPTYYSDTDSCNEFQTLPVTINGISAEQLTADCIDENGVNTKTKVYAFATKDDSIILTGFISNSNNEYNQYLPLFEESVKTIKITNPSDIDKSEMYKKYKELELQLNKTLS